MDNQLYKTSLEKKIETFQEVCKQSGLRVTPQRLEVYRALINMDNHPTAEEVYKKVREHLGNISFDTVNRTLLTLADVGAAFIVEGTGQPRRFDGGLEDHQHFRCIRCGRITDFHHVPFDHIKVPPELDPACQVVRKTVYFEGYCSDCRKLEGHACGSVTDTEKDLEKGIICMDESKQEC